jgi:hypothetical protein
MPYYRHKKEDIIYYVTDDPFIKPTTYKGKPSGCTISGTRETTFAINPTDPVTGRLSKSTTEAAITSYDTRDSQEEALRDYFLKWKPADSIEITSEEYEQLKEQYSQNSQS